MWRKKRIANLFKSIFNLKGVSILFTKDIFKNFIFIFLSLIFIPMALGILNLGENSDVRLINENRERIQKPGFSINSIFPYFEEYEKYYNDNFRFRDFLINRYNHIRYSLFKTSPVDSVLIGKDGWLFLLEEGGINLEKYYFSYCMFSESDLVLWETRLKERSDWAGSLGCEYIYVIVPNKQTVYPEMMPDGMDLPSSETMSGQMINYLSGREPGDCLIDLREYFLKKKRARRLYQKTDTHWSRFGAFLAYRAVIRSLSGRTGLDIRPDHIKKFDLISINREGGDLARMLYLGKKKFRENELILKRKIDLTIEEGEAVSGGLSGNIGWKKNPAANMQPMLFIHDSFGDYLKGYFPYHFRESYYSTDRNLPLYKDLIKSRGIRYIIEEIAERHFLQNPPSSVIDQ